jgi:hypothetical protein
LFALSSVVQPCQILLIIFTSPHPSCRMFAAAGTGRFARMKLECLDSS